MTSHGDHIATRETVRQQILDCERCELGVQSPRVPFTGTSWIPKLVLIGEAPGADEARQGEPFVGRAGKLLDDILIKIGLTRHHVFIANTVCCRPPSNRNPDAAEIASCRPNLEAQIALANSWVGVTLGKVALSAILGEPIVKFGKEVGKGFWAHGKWWIPTYHPAYALRNPGAKTTISVDLRKALRYRNGQLTPPEPRKAGWKIERGCMIVENESTFIPEKEAEAARAVFTRLEWTKLGMLTDDSLNAMILMKRELGAEVVS